MPTKYHPNHPPAFWAAVRVEYETTPMSQRALGRRHGVSYEAIHKRAMREGWVRAGNESQLTAAEGQSSAISRSPREILQEIAESKLQPGAARVAACKALLQLEKQAKPTEDETQDRVTQRALQLIEGGRR